MPQRFRAAISALGRDDTEELDRLTQTSGVGDYTINKLTARVADFTTMNITITLDLTNCLTDWLIAQKTETIRTPDSLEKADRIRDRARTECASIIIARNQWLKTQGISQDDFDRFNSSSSPMLTWFIDLSEGEQDPGLTASYLEAIEGYFKGLYPS